VAEKTLGISDFACVRPPLLTAGPASATGNLRTGWIWPDNLRKERVARGLKEAGPEIGWTIAKADVGRWISQLLVVGNDEEFGKCWTLTNSL
jgi:hypothetical protein